MAIAKLGPACLALLAAAPALAQEMPRYDVEGHCAEVSRMGGGSDARRSGARQPRHLRKLPLSAWVKLLPG